MSRKITICFLMMMFCGCSTAFKGPEVVYTRGQSCMVYTRQGSVPESAIYRDVWPVSPVVTVTNHPKPKIFMIPVIGTIISTVASVSSSIMSTGGSGKTYKYRDDLVIIGVTNLTAEAIGAILEKINTPHTDAQRSGWLPADSLKGE